MKYNNFKPKRSSCFKRWTNRGYAVFNSLRRCVKIGVLCASYTMLVLPLRCFAQTDTTQIKNIELEEVEVSAAASPDLFAPIGRTITQARKIDIERAAAHSPADLLKFIPNVDLRQRGPVGAQADISIRGASFDQTLILLNGMNITDPQTGHYSLNLPIDLESVEKIEILEGPAARIFGNNALGGAVNFITGTQPENHLKASISGGQYGFYKASLSATAHTRHTTHAVAVSQTASDGYRHNTDFKSLNVFAQNKWNNKAIPVDLQLGYTQRSFGANSFYGPKYPDQYELLNTFFAALKGEAKAGKFSVTPSAYWRRNYDQYILIRNNPEVYRNFHYTDVGGADVTASFAGRFGRTSAGILTRSERIFSNNLGKPMEEPPRKVPRQTDKWYDKTDQRINISAFAEQNLYIGKWSASAGILANRNNYTADKLNIYPGIDLAFRPNQAFKIYASANRAMRLPTFTDLYYQSPVHVSNINLKPENSTEYEIGTKMTANGWNVNVGYFYRSINNAIDWIWLDDQQKWHTLNFTNLYTHGISTGARWDGDDDSKLQSVAAYYTYMSSNKSANQFMSYYVMDYLRHKLDFSLTHRIVEKVCAHWQICRQDRNGGYLRYNAEDGTETETPYEAFWQINLRIYRQTKRLNIFVEASNLANKQHHDIGNVELPGRWIRTGVAVTFFSAPIKKKKEENNKFLN